MKPASLPELAEAIRRAARVEPPDLSHFRRVLEHRPEDMTVTVETGLVWSDFQAALAEHEQWLPVDPPLPALLTVREVLDQALSGPRRCGFGALREHVLGLRVVLASGEIIRTGGKVVKNVAGYDLTRLFTGARGRLGVIVEATFKVQPLPEMERFAEASGLGMESASDILAAFAAAEFSPSVLDLHNVPPPGGPKGLFIVAGFSGAREDVEAQMAEAAAMGLTQRGNLEHEKRFWEAAPIDGVRLTSVLPSKVTETIAALQPDFFVARAANGLIHCLGGKDFSSQPTAPGLNRRVKEAFDPEGKFG